MDLSEPWRLLQQQALSARHRLLRLAWEGALQQRLGAALLPQRAWLREGVCEPTEARITCLSPLGAWLPLAELRGAPFALELLLDDGAYRRFPLLLADVALEASDEGLGVVHLVGRDPLSLLAGRQRLRVLRDMSAPQAAQAVFEGWQREGLDGCFGFQWLQPDWARHPQRACFIQHPDESDAGFVQRLLRGSGLGWCWRPGPEAEEGRLPRQELLLFDEGFMLPAHAAGPVRCRRGRGGAVTDGCIEWLQQHWRLVAEGVELRSWDHETAGLVARSGFADQAPGAGEALVRALCPAHVAPPHLGDDAQDLERLARLEADHLRHRSHALQGRSGVRTLAAGTWQRIDDHPGLERLEPERREYTTVHVEHAAHGNLPEGLQGLVQGLLDAHPLPAWAHDLPVGSYANRFTAVPRRAPMVPLPAPEPPRLRPLTGLVVDAGAGEVHCDALGRSLVRLAGGEPGADTTAWVRHRTPWAGPQVGFTAALRAGTEVDIEWLGPDRPVIAGCHVNARTPPAHFDRLPGMPAHRALSGLVTRELDGLRQQQLRFDDSSGRIGVQLASDHAASQLNLGHLRTPLHEGRAAPRGQGAELCSTAAAAVRGEQGVLISADPGRRPDGHQLAREELLGLVRALQSALEQLGALARTHRTSGIDAARLQQLAQHLQQWERQGAPVVAVSAPAGCAVASQDNLLLGAQTHIDAVSAGHTQLSAGGQIRQRAGAGLSSFAHRGGIETVAGQGLVDVQAHDGDIHLTASGTIRLTAGVKVLIQAPQVEVVGDGAATHWGGGALTEQARGPYVVRSQSFAHTGPGDAAPPGVQPPGSGLRTDERCQVTAQGSGEPLAGRRYTAYSAEDGRVLGAGVTDGEGFTQAFKGVAIAAVRIVVHPEEEGGAA